MNIYFVLKKKRPGSSNMLPYSTTKFGTFGSIEFYFYTTHNLFQNYVLSTKDKLPVSPDDFVATPVEIQYSEPQKKCPQIFLSKEKMLALSS